MGFVARQMVNTPVTFWFALATITLQASSTVIELGSSLRAGESWDSPHKSFRFGLWPKNNMLALAIRFLDDTTVWSATDATQSSELQVSLNAVVVLENEGIQVKDGEKVVWKTCIDSPCTTRIDGADMLDTGNFVLREKSAVVWSSFNNPTDTLLPGQQLIGSQFLVSGRYRLRLEKKQVLLESLDFKPPNSANSLKSHVNYWSLQTENSEAVTAHGDAKLNFSANGILSFYDATGKNNTDEDSQSNLPASCRNFLRSQSTIRFAIDYNSANVSMRRLKVEPNGNLVSYSLEKGSKAWKKVWQAVLNECEIYATCGPFGICTFRPTRSCTCPPGFHHVNKDDDSSGCDYNFPIKDGSATKLVSVNRAHFEYGNEQVSNEQYLAAVSMEECKMNCLKDSQCVAAEFTIDGTGNCYQKIGKLYNGRQVISGNSHAVVFMKISVLDVGAVSDPSDPFVSNVSTSNPDINVFNRKITSITFRVVVLLACMLLLSFGTVITVGLLWRRDRQRLMRKYMIDIEGAPAIFSYKELQDATNNFTEKLGSGGFGSVYKGVLADKRIVAVKDLQGADNFTRQQFKVEVSTIATIHHVNLVRLLGYCAEGEHRLLVLEYMKNGSLEKLLFTKVNSAESINFDWTTRFNIALGIARGITYLHEECHECILHCDIKPHNILLGDNFEPKLSDFGLAKLVSKEQVLSVTTIRGTRGYIAPEWVSNSQITPKVDVYSFGMVLMELISGRDVSTLTPSAEDNGVWSFPSLAFYKLRDSDLRSILDQRLMLGGEVDWRQIERVVKIALWCIQLEPSTRPSMNKVVQMLEDNVDVSMPPLPKMLDNDTIRLFVDGSHDDPSKSSATLTGR